MPSEVTIFDEARGIPDPASRAAYLDRACGDDPDLRRRVEEWLAADVSAAVAGFLAPPQETGTATFVPGEGADGRPADETPVRAGTVVGGRYKLVEPVGEGGMGAVWVARQTDPVKRLVAVKLIKPGMDSRQVLARFEAERQALALMDHPNIARVLDAGTAADGRPFFVMELVKGVPITAFCDARKLSVRDRLGLFADVCRAVQHAHQKGVIHRDIKPTNVLVGLYDDRAVPKVIDFGVAKAAGEPLTDKTLHTGIGAVVGTPAYMAPEQATLNNLDVDTRADVYGLGALLYELLTGSPPFGRADLKRAGVLEMLRVVREVDPPRPSTRVSTADGRPSIAAVRGTDPGALARLLRSDLDWVVMKALEKDRARRYETAAGLAADVDRYLAGEALLAAPPSAWYRARKLLRRHRAATVVGAVVALALAVGAGGLVWAVLGAEAAAARDRAAREKAQALTARLRQLLDSADPSAGGGPAMTVRRLLDEQAPKLCAGLDGQPEVEADLRHTIGRVYLHLLATDDAIPYFERAAHLRRHALSPDPLGLAEVLTDLAHVYGNAAFERQFGGAGRQAYLDQAVAAAREAVDLRRAGGGPADELADALFMYAAALRNQTYARPPAARDHRPIRDALREVLGAAERCPAGPGRARRLSRYHELMSFDLDAAPLGSPESVDHRQKAADRMAEAQGPNHLHTGVARVLLGETYLAAHEYARAEAELREALWVYEGIFGGGSNPYSVVALRLLVTTLAWQYRDAEVAEVVGRAGPDSRAQNFRGVWGVVAPLEWGEVCLERGDYADAERHYRDALAAALGRPAAEVNGMDADARYWVAVALVMQGKWPEAGAEVRPWLEDARKVAGGDPPPPAAVLPSNAVDRANFYATVLMMAGLTHQPDAAAAKQITGRRLRDADVAARPEAERLQFRVDDACADYVRRNCLPVPRELPAALKGLSPWAWHDRRQLEQILVESYDKLNRPGEAERVRQESVENAEELLPRGHPEVAARRVLQADTLTRHDRRGDAAKVLEQAYDEFTAYAAAHPAAVKAMLGRRADAADRLFELYSRDGPPKAAARWRDVKTSLPPDVTPYPRPRPMTGAGP